MFSTIGNIFSPRTADKTRPAEQTDTRQAIQRHEPEFEDRSSGSERAGEDDLQNNAATVSVEALRIFLENFVKGKETQAAQALQAQEASETPPQEDMIKTQSEKTPPAPPTNQAARAANAYQASAHVDKKEAVLLETTDSAGGPELDLSAADIRSIYTLIDDLKILEDKKIEYLRIERAASFLESLIAAVFSSKSQIK